MNPLEYNPRTSIEREYEDAAGTHFWPWLQERVTATQYAAMRGLPLPLIKQMHQVEWSAFVRQQVEARRQEALQKAMAKLVRGLNLKGLAETTIVLDEAWAMKDGKQ